MVFKDIGAKAREARTLMAWTYSPTCLKMKLHIIQCGKGETKTKGVFQNMEFAKGVQIGERVVTSVWV